MSERLTSPSRHQQPASSAQGILQRKCACGQHTPGGGECEECQKKHDGTLQRSAAGTDPASDIHPVVHEVLRSSGQPLDRSVRDLMEPRFGHDFSKVRIHTDGQAAGSALAVDALAYTVGNRIVFGPGQYAPQTLEGRKLLAHELAHTIQQGPVAPSASLSVSDPRGALESEADAAAERVSLEGAPSSSQGGPVRLSRVSGSVGIARKTTAVGFKTIDGPRWDPCGGFAWKARWLATQESGEALQPKKDASESWIVQEYTAKRDIKDCSDKVVDQSTNTYYEAWRVGKDGWAISNYKYDFNGDGKQEHIDYDFDNKSDDDFLEPDRPRTKGEWSRNTYGYWVSTINKGEFTPKSVKEAGQLPATRKRPASLGSWSIHRACDAKWDCCSKPQTLQGSASADNKWATYQESWGLTPAAHEKTVDKKKVIEKGVHK